MSKRCLYCGKSGKLIKDFENDSVCKYCHDHSSKLPYDFDLLYDLHYVVDLRRKYMNACTDKLGLEELMDFNNVDYKSWFKQEDIKKWEL
jgi:hypothetical protein